MVLIAVVCAVIGTVTTLALRSHLYAQLDGQLSEVAQRASGQFRPPDQLGQDGTAGIDGQHRQPQQIDLTDFVTKGPQPGGTTVVAKVENGRITDSRRGQKSQSNFQMSAKTPTQAQLAALSSVRQADKTVRTVGLPGPGSYRVEFRTGSNGKFYVALPTSDLDGTINTLIRVEISVPGTGLIAACLAGSVLAGVATRPLRRVAATATRVSELPLTPVR